MKICFISDTHNLHKVFFYLEKERLENIDLLIHAGDFSMSGTESETKDFIKWLNRFPARYKVFIGGNHDSFLEKAPFNDIRILLDKNVFYLNNNGIIIEGIQIWGSPIQPGTSKRPFKKKSGAEIIKHWQLIPKHTDILITHSPPFGILDKTKKNLNAGCKDLLKKVKDVKPIYHVFGHIHEDHGQFYDGTTYYINASLLDMRYRLLNDPIILNYKKRPGIKHNFIRYLKKWGIITQYAILILILNQK